MRRKKRSLIGLCIFPGYRWCGPGCNGPGDPINPVDAACKHHDECYAQRKNFCYCDLEFMRELRPLVNFHTLQGRQAWLLYNYAAVQSAFLCALLGRI
jgi:hypothetical protein